MKKIVVMVSGGGTNLQVLIDGTTGKEIKGKIVGVISNREDAYGLTRAKNHDIPTFVIAPKKKAQDQELLECLQALSPDLIILAGYLKILPVSVVKAYEKKIINIHPSLIPKHCGPGYYGLKVHQSVLDHHETLTGVTLHYVDEGVDTGEIILQRQVEVKAGDSAESLAKRVLKVEHAMLLKTVKGLCE